MSDEELEELRRKKFESYMKMRSMPKKVLYLDTAQEFDRISNEFPDKLIIIDFWAEWCGPCMSFAPVFEKLQQEFSTEYVFAKVNVDKNGAIAQRYSISGIPTTLFMKNGRIIHKQVGAMNYNSMKTILRRIKTKL